MVERTFPPTSGKVPSRLLILGHEASDKKDERISTFRRITASPHFSQVTIFIVVAFIVGLTVYVLTHNQGYLSRHSLGLTQRFIRSFGALSPFIVLLLIFLSTAIPPLPLPVPLIELAAGLIFGLWEGALVVWVSQVSSSLFAFYLARSLKKGVLDRILRARNWDFYRVYLSRRGPFAVFMTRLTMSAPFNIISYLAGLTPMNTTNFALATALGVIPESLIYSFLGSRIRLLRASLLGITTVFLCLGMLGFVLTLFMVRFLRPSAADKAVIANQ